MTGVPFNDAYRYIDGLLTVLRMLVDIHLAMYRDDADRAHPRSRLGWKGNLRSSSLVAIWDDDIRLPLSIKLEAGQLEVQAEDTSDYELREPIDVVVSEFVRSASRQVRARRQ